MDESNIVEDVARALSAEANGPDVADRNWPAWAGAARAAIEAVRRSDVDARFIAQLAPSLSPVRPDGQQVYPGTPEADALQVERARKFLAESRRQVAAERGSA